MCDMNGSILTTSSCLASVLFSAAVTHVSQVAVKTLLIELEAQGPGFGQMCSAQANRSERMVRRSLRNKV